VDSRVGEVYQQIQNIGGPKFGVNHDFDDTTLL
jgi:hypothetical protein